MTAEHTPHRAGLTGKEMTQTYKYIQAWYKYRGAAGYMLRFYLPRSELPDKHDLSPASAKAWDACDRAYRQLSDAERQIIRTYYTLPYHKPNAELDPICHTAETYGLDISSVRQIIDKVIRMVVINRGLADE